MFSERERKTGDSLIIRVYKAKTFENKQEEEERNRMGSSSKKALGTTGEFFRRRDEWRKHPMLTNQLRHATPGLGIALVAFGVYLVGEQVYNRVISPSAASSSHAHSHSHSASTTSATH